MKSDARFRKFRFWNKYLHFAEPAGGSRALTFVQLLFSAPSRYAPDPPGLILGVVEAARQAALRAVATRRAGR